MLIFGMNNKKELAFNSLFEVIDVKKSVHKNMFDELSLEQKDVQNILDGFVEEEKLLEKSELEEEKEKLVLEENKITKSDDLKKDYDDQQKLIETTFDIEANIIMRKAGDLSGKSRKFFVPRALNFVLKERLVFIPLHITTYFGKLLQRVEENEPLSGIALSLKNAANMYQKNLQNVDKFFGEDKNSLQEEYEKNILRLQKNSDDRNQALNLIKNGTTVFGKKVVRLKNELYELDKKSKAFDEKIKPLMLSQIIFKKKEGYCATCCDDDVTVGTICLNGKCEYFQCNTCIEKVGSCPGCRGTVISKI